MKTLERKNFNLGIMSGAVAALYGAFVSADIVMPMFLRNYTSSKAIVGLTSALLTIGWFFPQFFEGYFAEKKPLKMPAYRAAGWVRSVVFAFVPAIVMLYGNSDPNTILFILLSLFLIYSLSNGVAGLAYTDIVAKVIPQKKRPSFFGGRLFWGGILAVFGGFFVSYVLNDSETFPFPVNYSILFSIAFILLAATTLFFCEIKEPAGPVVARSFKSYFNEAVKIIKRNKNFRWLVVTRYLCGATAIAFPFYVLFGIECLGLPKSIIGAFILSQVLGRIISNLFWGYLGEKEGSKLVLSVYAVMSLSAPVIAILASFFEVWRQMYIFTFLLLGFAESGAEIGFFNFLLDISPEKKRSSIVGLTHTIITPVVLAPFVGGILIDLIGGAGASGTSYRFVFMLALCFGLLGLLSTFGLKSPKRQEEKEEG